MPKKTLREIAESPVDPRAKITFWKEEEINARSDIRDGLKDLQTSLQTGKPLKEMIRGSLKANRKINFNRKKLFHAKRQRLKAEASMKKRKKYWK